MKNIFSIFKKKEDKFNEIELLSKIFNQIEGDYLFIQNQINQGLILGFKKIESPSLSYSKSLFDVKLLNKFEDKKGRSFTLDGIKIKDLTSNKIVGIKFEVCYGILQCYYFENNIDVNPDFDSIDLTNFSVKYHDEIDFEKITKILNKEELKLINSSDVYEVEINGKIYFHIKDLEDGDFIGMDNQKCFYEVTHDPLEAKKIDKNLKEILK